MKNIVFNDDIEKILKEKDPRNSAIALQKAVTASRRNVSLAQSNKDFTTEDLTSSLEAVANSALGLERVLKDVKKADKKDGRIVPITNLLFAMEIERKALAKRLNQELARTKGQNKELSNLGNSVASREPLTPIGDSRRFTGRSNDRDSNTFGGFLGGVLINTIAANMINNRTGGRRRSDDLIGSTNQVRGVRESPLGAFAPGRKVNATSGASDDSKVDRENLKINRSTFRRDTENQQSQARFWEQSQAKIGEKLDRILDAIKKGGGVGGSGGNNDSGFPDIDIDFGDKDKRGRRGRNRGTRGRNKLARAGTSGLAGLAGGFLGEQLSENFGLIEDEKGTTGGGATAGALAGGVAGSFIPIPGVGTFVGATAGGFIGNELEKYFQNDNSGAAAGLATNPGNAVSAKAASKIKNLDAIGALPGVYDDEPTPNTTAVVVPPVSIEQKPTSGTPTKPDSDDPRIFPGSIAPKVKEDKNPSIVQDFRPPPVNTAPTAESYLHDPKNFEQAATVFAQRAATPTAAIAATIGLPVNTESLQNAAITTLVQTPEKDITPSVVQEKSYFRKQMEAKKAQLKADAEELRNDPTANVSTVTNPDGTVTTTTRSSEVKSSSGEVSGLAAALAGNPNKDAILEEYARTKDIGVLFKPRPAAPQSQISLPADDGPEITGSITPKVADVKFEHRAKVLSPDIEINLPNDIGRDGNVDDTAYEATLADNVPIPPASAFEGSPILGVADDATINVQPQGNLIIQTEKLEINGLRGGGLKGNVDTLSSPASPLMSSADIPGVLSGGMGGGRGGFSTGGASSSAIASAKNRRETQPVITKKVESSAFDNKPNMVMPDGTGGAGTTGGGIANPYGFGGGGTGGFSAGTMGSPNQMPGRVTGSYNERGATPFTPRGSTRVDVDSNAFKPDFKATMPDNVAGEAYPGIGNPYAITGIGKTSGYDAGQSTIGNVKSSYIEPGSSTMGSGEGTPYTDPSKFQDPSTNPNVNQDIIGKYARQGRQLPVVIRNNNPAALSLMKPGSGEFAEKQEGYVGATPRPANEGGYYAKFATPEHGVAANAKLLERYGDKGINTPDQIVRKWSVDPNAHAAYSKRLQEALGVSGDTPLDLKDKDIQAKILGAKSAHESGTGKPIYSEDTFRRGVNRDFSGGKGPAPSAAPGSTTSPQASTAAAPAITGENSAGTIAPELREQIKGTSNLASKSPNPEYYGDPNSPDFKQKNLTTVTLDSGKKVTVNSKSAESYKGFLNELEGTGYKIDSLGGFANRGNVNNPSKPSMHSFGTAIDINPSQNPNQPGQTGPGITNLPKNVSDMAAKYGLSWGGDWKNLKDTMHFEHAGELADRLKQQTAEAAKNGTPSGTTPQTAAPVYDESKTFGKPFANSETPTTPAKPTKAPSLGALMKEMGVDPADVRKGLTDEKTDSTVATNPAPVSTPTVPSTIPNTFAALPLSPMAVQGGPELGPKAGVTKQDAVIDPVNRGMTPEQIAEIKSSSTGKEMMTTTNRVKDPSLTRDLQAEKEAGVAPAQPSYNTPNPQNLPANAATPSFNDRFGSMFNGADSSAQPKGPTALKDALDNAKNNPDGKGSQFNPQSMEELTKALDTDFKKPVSANPVSDQPKRWEAFENKISAGTMAKPQGAIDSKGDIQLDNDARVQKERKTSIDDYLEELDNKPKPVDKYAEEQEAWNKRTAAWDVYQKEQDAEDSKRADALAGPKEGEDLADFLKRRSTVDKTMGNAETDKQDSKFSFENKRDDLAEKFRQSQTPGNWRYTDADHIDSGKVIEDAKGRVRTDKFRPDEFTPSKRLSSNEIISQYGTPEYKNRKASESFDNKFSAGWDINSSMLPSGPNALNAAMGGASSVDAMGSPNAISSAQSYGSERQSAAPPPPPPAPEPAANTESNSNSAPAAPAPQTPAPVAPTEGSAPVGGSGGPGINQIPTKHDELGLVLLNTPDIN